MASVGSSSTDVLNSLATKQDLLIRLVQHEYSRLQVWLYPLVQEPKHVFTSARGDKHPLAVRTQPFYSVHHRLQLQTLSAPALKVAWTETPSLALQIAMRAQLHGIMKEIRWKLLNHTEEAIDEPEALHALFGDGVTRDISFQLKVTVSISSRYCRLT